MKRRKIKSPILEAFRTYWAEQVRRYPRHCGYLEELDARKYFRAGFIAARKPKVRK